MARGVFVTGTDTGVGKTVVSAALICRYRQQLRVRYWKPIQTGIELDDDTVEVARLSAASADEIVAEGVRLANPVSPHIAARRAGVTIDLEPLEERVRRSGEASWIVEGAGGALVPINDDSMMATLIGQLDLPAVIVARTSLGTINHTLLTVEALRHRGIEIAGVVLVGAPDPDARESIVRYGRVEILGDMPRFDRIAHTTIAAWAPQLDAGGQLMRWLA